MRDRTIEWVISAGAVATALVAGFDLPSATAGLVVLTFLLVAPGLAMSLHVGPMTIEARVLVSIVGSVSLTTLVSLALIYVDAWSSDLGVAVIVLVTQLITVAAMPRRQDAPSQESDAPNASSPPDASQTTEPRA